VRGEEMFSAVTVDALARAGYVIGRRIDTAPFERALAENGFTVMPSVRAFLAQWGGLRVSLPHRRLPNVTTRFDFDAARAASGIYPERVDVLSERAGAPLCPVGQGYGAVLLMDPAGAVYAALDDWFVKVGSSGEETIEVMCTSQKTTPMP
jgi:hypothetical protein